MHITGIVTEYNPIHKGHRYHIEKTRELTNCDVLVAVMSGNFVQRGEPAIYDKWERAEAAIKQGCDLVIELPFIYATQSADHFAKGAIDILSLAKVQDIVFGSECGDIEKLKALATIDTSSLSTQLQNGESLPSVLGKLYGDITANDILGINYIKAIGKHSMKPYAIKRTNSYHEELMNDGFASATAIRKAIHQGIDVNHQTPMQHLKPRFLENYYPYIQMLLLTSSAEILRSVFLMDEGIEHLLIKAARTCMNLDAFLDTCISRRYTRSRIRRILIHLIHQTTKQEVAKLPPIAYIRVLAYNRIGQQHLKALSESTTIASRFNQIPSPYREMELKAAHVYAYPLQGDDKAACYQSELQPPRFIK